MPKRPEIKMPKRTEIKTPKRAEIKTCERAEIKTAKRAEIMTIFSVHNFKSKFILEKRVAFERRLGRHHCTLHGAN